MNPFSVLIVCVEANVLSIEILFPTASQWEAQSSQYESWWSKNWEDIDVYNIIPISKEASLRDLQKNEK